MNGELLEKAQKSIHTNLTRVGKKLYKGDAAKVDSFVKESFDRVKVSTKLEDGADVDLVVEAIVEKLDVKQELFNKLDQVCLCKYFDVHLLYYLIIPPSNK